MTPEQFERLKEQEKEHLRAVRQLQATARRLRMQRSVQDALRGMLEGPREALDTYDEMMYRLALETARNEAQYELATEDLPDEETPRDDAAVQKFEEQQLDARAQEIVRHMKQALKETPDKVSKQLAEETKHTEEEESSGGEPQSSDDAPEKTIGRM